MRGTVVLSMLLATGCGGTAAVSEPAATSTSSADGVLVTAAESEVGAQPVMTAQPPAEPQFVWNVAPVTAADLPHSWRDGCPVPPELLRAVTLSHHGFDGQVHEGVLVVHEDVVAPALAAFEALFEQRFPIRSVVPVDAFGGSDDASMAADNTSGFNCRAVTGGTSWSQHAYGRAIDVNPVENPYLLAGDVLPPAGAEFADRTQDRPGMLRAGTPGLQAFLDAGFSWGGLWSNPDYQHLQR